MKIGRFMPSSKTYSCRGYKIDKLPLNVRLFECPTCELIEDGEVDASIYICNFSLADALEIMLCKLPVPQYLSAQVWHLKV